jgi:hypothetical protein
MFKPKDRFNFTGGQPSCPRIGVVHELYYQELENMTEDLPFDAWTRRLKTQGTRQDSTRAKVSETE